MFQVYAAMPAQDHDFNDDLLKPIKARGRVPSDELSTAAPSPEASPLFGPQDCTPLLGPDELLLPDLGSFQLPEAQESPFGSEAEFELAGFDDEDCDLISDHSCGEDQLSDRDEDEDVESQLIAVLGELAAMRAEARRGFEQSEPHTSFQKIPYPQLQSGFLPTEFMPCKSWMVPAGQAQTGQWACAMAPRPANDCMEPLDVVFGEAGVTLEVASPLVGEDSSEMEKRRICKAKAVFRRRAGRSRSPVVLVDEMMERGASPRGRPM